MRPTSHGWFLELTHPSTGRSVTPSLLSNPTFTPAVNGLPTLQAPIRKRTTYLQDEWDNAALEAWFEGEQAPIDELDAVELESGRMALIGVGGTELRARVSREFRLEYPEQAAKDLVENNTSYTVDVTDPNWTVDTGQTLQDTANGDTLAEVFSEALNDPELPVKQDGSNNITTTTTCFTDYYSGGWSLGGGERANTSYVDGVADELSDGDSISYTFTPEHTIPSGDFAVDWRVHPGPGLSNGTDILGYKIELDGETIRDIGGWTADDLQWFSVSISEPSSDIDDSQHTLTITAQDDLNDGGSFAVDVLAPNDDGGRYGGFSYTFDNTVHQDNGHLDGPGTKPDAVDVRADRHAQAFNLTKLSLSTTFDDTSSDQALALANDAPSENFDEASNTTSHTVDFDAKGELGAIAQGRVTFSRWSKNGTRDDTPRENYSGQTLTDFTLTGDVERAPMLIDQRVDDRLENVLTDIAGTEFLWEFVNDDGTETVRWARPGDRVASSVPDTVPELSLTKHSELIEKVTIKGSNRSVSDERFTSSNSFEDLNRDNLIPNSESVYDPDSGDSFDRDVDYEMDYGDGQIRRKSGGDLTNGDTVSIDYQFETSGTHTDPNAGGSPLEIVEEIPGLTSDNAAEQVAWFLVDEFKDPRYEAEVRIPPREQIFSGIEALSLAFRDADRLPDDALPLSPRNVERDASQLVVRLGSEREFSAAIRSVRSQVAQISRRV